ncbi:Translation elongation factor 1 beta [Xylographa carneopallida]|nr:Translation elongation factor 1 beta [Xylographa carneopallida]
MASLSDDDEDEGAGAAAQALIAKKNAEREAAKRASKGGPTAKSSLILDIKPEDSETDMNELLGEVKRIEMEGLTWGGHEFIPVAFGIKKLRIIVRTAALSKPGTAVHHYPPHHCRKWTAMQPLTLHSLTSPLSAAALYDLQEAIEALDGVQSTDIHAFNKL